MSRRVFGLVLFWKNIIQQTNVFFVFVPSNFRSRFVIVQLFWVVGRMENAKTNSPEIYLKKIYFKRAKPMDERNE